MISNKLSNNLLLRENAKVVSVKVNNPTKGSVKRISLRNEQFKINREDSKDDIIQRFIETYDTINYESFGGIANLFELSE